MKEFGEGAILRRWRTQWYIWTPATCAYLPVEDEALTAMAVRFQAARAMAVTTTSTKNLTHALLGLTHLSDEVEPPCWLPSAIDGKSKRSKGAYVALMNGVLDLDTPGMELLPISSDFFTLCALPFKYDGEADCPLLKKCLERWHPNAPEVHAVMQGWAGYVFEPGNPRQKFMINLGEGSDGKSVFSAVMGALVGERNVSGVGLEAFDPNNRFGLQPVLGKLLNITGDAEALEKVAEGLLKAITGGDLVTIDRKNKPPLNVRLGTKFLMNGNDTPFFRDRSDGIWRRMLIVRWTQQILENEKDERIVEKLLAELPGIFNWAVEGYHAVKRAGFVMTGKLEQSLYEARSSTQSEIRFFDEELIVDEHFNESQLRVGSDELMKAFGEWCERNNVKPFLNANNLGKAMKRYLKRTHVSFWQEVEALGEDGFRKRYTSGKRGYFYVGVEIVRDTHGEQSAGSRQLTMYNN
jgi:putative DNA primase/helicase